MPFPLPTVRQAMSRRAAHARFARAAGPPVPFRGAGPPTPFRRAGPDPCALFPVPPGRDPTGDGAPAAGAEAEGEREAE
jgi:hypothetical protein